MLDIADSLAVYIEAKGVKMKSDELENLTIVNGSLKLTHFAAKNDKVKLTHP
jgi:dsDNA-binding SOS-regulon protein